MAQPAKGRIEKGAQVIHAVFEHRQPVDAATEGKALVAPRVQVAIFQHLGIDHAAAEYFQPVVALADAQLAIFEDAADIHFGGRFGEGKIAGAEAHLYIIDLEKG